MEGGWIDGAEDGAQALHQVSQYRAAELCTLLPCCSFFFFFLTSVWLSNRINLWQIYKIAGVLGALGN